MVCITGQVPTRRHRHRRLPGVRHHRHHPVGHQAQRAGHRGRRTSRCIVREAFHIATTGRPGPGAGRHPQGHRRPHEPALGHGVVLADRRRGRGHLPGYQPTTKGHPQDDPRGGRADPRGPHARSSTPAAASSRPGRPRRCASWPSCATSTSSPRSWPGAPSPTTTRCASACRACTATTPRSRRCSRADLLIALGSPLRRPGHRQGRRLRPRRQDHPRRHRPGRAGQGPPARRADRRRLPPRHRGADRRPSATCRRRRRRSPDRSRVEVRPSRAGRRSSRSPTSSPSRASCSSRSSCSSSCATTRPTTCIVASGVGQHQMWTSQYWKFNHPYTWVNSGGLGTMGFSRARPPSAPRSAGPTAWCGPSTATAASR